jgi:hypothetical protein
MGHVTIPQPPAQTSTSRDLEKLIQKTIEDFRRTHAKVTDEEIRSALRRAMPSSAEATARELRIAGIVVAVIVVVVALVIALALAAESNRGDLVITVLVTACALAGLGVAALRT